MIELRAYRRDDFETLYALDCTCFEKPFRFSRAMLKQVLRAPTAQVTVAWEGDAVVGFGAAEIEAGRAYVATLDVSPASQRRGVGKMLMTRLEAMAAAGGAAEIWLHVFVGNGPALRLYEGLGYLRLGRQVGFYGRGLDAWVYGKGLAGPASPTQEA